MIPGSAAQHGIDDKWLVIEDLQVATGSLVIDASAASGAEMYSGRSCLYIDGAKVSTNSKSDNIQISKRHYDSQNQSLTGMCLLKHPTDRILLIVLGENPTMTYYGDKFF